MVVPIKTIVMQTKPRPAVFSSFTGQDAGIGRLHLQTPPFLTCIFLFQASKNSPCSHVAALAAPEGQAN